jgi:TonB family protein
MILALLVAMSAVQDSSVACRFDTAAHLRTDSIVVALATGSRLGYGSGLANEYADAAEVIHEYFQPPARLTLPVWARTYWTGHTHLDTDDPSHGFDGDVRFQLDSAARVVAGSIAVATLADDLAGSVRAAIVRADSAHAFARPSARLLKEHGLVLLHFATPRAREPHVALLRVIVPALRLDRVPALDWVPRVQYPAAMRNANLGGRVVLQFVIDEGGHVDSTSVAVVQGHYPEFADEAMRAVKPSRFRPAKIGDCAVPVLVRLPFDFKTQAPRLFTQMISP